MGRIFSPFSDCISQYASETQYFLLYSLPEP